MSEAVAAVERFRQALLDGDEQALNKTLTDNVFWSIGGESPIAGDSQELDAVVGMFATLRTLTGATFRPYNPNSYDVLESEYHCALVDRWVAERDGKALDSHQAWIIHLADGLVADGFHYFADQPPFDDSLS